MFGVFSHPKSLPNRSVWDVSPMIFSPLGFQADDLVVKLVLVIYHPTTNFAVIYITSSHCYHLYRTKPITASIAMDFHIGNTCKHSNTLYIPI